MFVYVMYALYNLFYHFVQFVLSLCIISTLNKTIEKSRQNMNDKLCLIELVNLPTDSVGGQHRLTD